MASTSFPFTIGTASVGNITNTSPVTQLIALTSEPPDDHTSNWERTSTILWKFIPPLILIFGTIGNITSILVLRRMSKGGSAFPVFFMALAVSDLAILYVTLLRKWLGKGFGVRLSDTHDVPCKLYHWVGYSVGMLSAWFLAALAVQRAMTVAWPHGMRASCTRTQSFITIAVLVAVAFGLNAYTLFTTAVREDGRCGFSKDFQVSYQPVLGWFEMILYSLLPATVIVLSNCLLIYKFVQSRKRLESQSSRICRSGSTKVSRVTLTLIVVSLAFLVCTLPLGMMQDPSQTSPDLFRSESFVFWLSFASFLWYTNSAINFYIYLLTGSQFREELKKMLGIRERNPSGKARKEDF